MTSDDDEWAEQVVAELPPLSADQLDRAARALATTTEEDTRAA
jgi:hypothetical protein